MFSESLESFRDVIVFAEGACHGLRPPHGAGALPGLSEYLSLRFGRSEPRSWTSVLVEHFGHLPFEEGCEAARRVLDDWRQSLPTSSGALVPPT